MSRTRKHRHSTRHIFPRLVQAVPATPPCGACASGYRGSHPGRGCFTPQTIDALAALAELELRVKYATLGVTCTTVETQPCDPALVREVIRAYELAHTDVRQHLPIVGCDCVECGGMPTWAYDWLNRDLPVGSQADLPIQVVDSNCRN